MTITLAEACRTLTVCARVTENVAANKHAYAAKAGTLTGKPSQ